MNLYKNHSNRELLAVLEQCEKLTYEAQLDLSSELSHREIASNSSHLEDEIGDTEQAISELKYLKDLGFQCEENVASGRLEIKRTTAAKWMDGVSVVLGTAFFAIGLVYFWLLMAMFFGDNEFELGKLVMYGLMILLGGIGFKMLSGIHRFLDYINFSLVKDGDAIQLSNHTNAKDLLFTATDVSTELEGEELILKVGAIEIVRASDTNLLQKMTIEELERKLKTNE